MGNHLPRVKFSTILSTLFAIFFPNFESYTPFPEPRIEEKSSFERSLEEAIEAQKQFENNMASSCPQNFQNSCSSFPEQLKGKSLWKKTMEFVQETERIMQNTIDFPCSSNVQESCHFGNPVSISSYQPKLDQHPIPDTLTSYPFLEIELEDECEHELQVSDSSPFTESLSTLIVLPKLNNILEPVLIPIIPELDSIISPIHISSVDKNQDSMSLHPFELTQNLDNHLDILASYPFPEIELELESDPDVSDLISLFDSIMTPVSLPDFFLYSGINIESCTSTP